MKRILSTFLCAVVMMVSITACSKPFEKLSAAELLSFGEKYLVEMNYEQAIVYFEKLIIIEPMNPRGYTGLAEAFAETGEIAKAIDILREGLARLPNDANIIKMLDAYMAKAYMEVPTASPVPTAEPTVALTAAPAVSAIPSLPENSLGRQVTIQAVLVDNEIEYAEQYELYQSQRKTGIPSYIKMYGFRFEPPLIGVNGEEVFEATAGDANIELDEDSLSNGQSVLLTGQLNYNEDYNEIYEFEGMFGTGWAYEPNGAYIFEVAKFEILDDKKSLLDSNITIDVAP